MDCSPPGSSVLVDSPGKNTGVSCLAFLQGNLPDLGIKPDSPTWQTEFFTTELPEKPLQVLYIIYIYIYINFFFFKRSLQVGQTKNHESGDGRHSPHDRATVTSFVGARVAAARGRRRITGVDVNGTQLVPAEHGQKVLLPWGGWAVGRLVGRSSIAPPVGTSTGREA